jgi:hypothetical protein
MVLYCNTHGINLEVVGATRRVTLAPIGPGRFPPTLCALLANADVELHPDLPEKGSASIRVKDVDGQETKRACEVVVR